MSAFGDEGPFGVVARESDLRETLAALRRELLESTTAVRLEIQSLRDQVADLSAAAGGGGGGSSVSAVVSPADLPGLRAEIRSTLRESTEHLRTLLVEEVNELRGELQGVRARLTDRRTQDRAELQTSLAAGSDTLRAALAEDAAAVRAEIEAVRAQLKDQQVADQQLLRAELRAALREWNEHLRTRIVEEATDLRGELHQVRGALTDQQTQHRSDLKVALGEGSGQVLGALTEATAALRSEVASAVAQQEQLRAALMAEIEWLRADVRAVPTQIEEQRTAAQVDTRAAVHEGTQAAEVAFAQHVDRLLAEIQHQLVEHEVRHGDEGQQLRAIVAAGTDTLRAAVLAETATARDALIEHTERLRGELQAVWAHLNDQHADERSELGRAVAEGTDHVRSSLRREIEAIGTGMATAQAAAQDELAALRGRVEAFSALFSSAQTAARGDLAELRAQVEAVRAALVGAQEDSAIARVQLDALGMDITTAQAVGRDEATATRALVDENAHALRTVFADEQAALRTVFADEQEAMRTVLADQQAAAHTLFTEELAAVRARLDEEQAGVRALLSGELAAVRARFDEVAEVAAVDLNPLRAQLEALAAEIPVRQEVAQESLRAAVTSEIERLRSAVETSLAEGAADTQQALLDRSDVLRAEMQAVWGQLNDQHGEERAQLEATVRENGEQVRASLLVELTEFIQGQVETLSRTAAAAVSEQLEPLRVAAAAAGAEGQARHDALMAELAASLDRLTNLHLEVESWRQQAGEERTAEVDALLAAVAGNEERLNDAFASAAQERQAQLAYLEAALQTFNQALALEREEMRALITWSQEATDAAVGDLGGRLDALARMVTRVLSGEGMLEVTEGLAALRSEVSALDRKLPDKPAKATAAPSAAKRVAVRKTPPSRTPPSRTPPSRTPPSRTRRS